MSEEVQQPEILLQYESLTPLEESCLAPSVSTHEQHEILQSKLIVSIKGLPHESIAPFVNETSFSRALSLIEEQGLSDGDKLDRLASRVQQRDAIRLYLMGLNSMAKQFPDLSFWRGGEFSPDSLTGDFALSLPIALQNLPNISPSAGTLASQPREMPSLIRLSLNLPIESLLNRVEVVGLGAGLSSAAYEITLSVDEPLDLGVNFYRASDKNPNELYSYAQRLKDKASSMQIF